MSEYISDFKGAVFLDKRILETEWFTGCSPTAVCLMFYLLLKANYEETVWKGIKLRRGEVIGSIGNDKNPGTLMENTNLPYSTLRDALKRLEGLGEISISAKKGNKGYTLIKVVNYDQYTCYANIAAKKTDKNTTKKTDKKSANSKETKETIDKPDFTMEEINEMFPD